MTMAIDRSGPEGEDVRLAADRVVELAQALRLAALHDGIDSVSRLGAELDVAVGTVAYAMGRLDGPALLDEPEL